MLQPFPVAEAVHQYTVDGKDAVLQRNRWAVTLQVITGIDKLYGGELALSSRFTPHLPFNPAIPFLKINAKDTLAKMQSNVITRLLISQLIIIAKWCK